MDEFVEAVLPRYVDDPGQGRSECDDRCVDERCFWFFIHGKRSGNPQGITTGADR